MLIIPPGTRFDSKDLETDGQEPEVMDDIADEEGAGADPEAAQTEVDSRSLDAG